MLTTVRSGKRSYFAKENALIHIRMLINEFVFPMLIIELTQNKNARHIFLAISLHSRQSGEPNKNSRHFLVYFGIHAKSVP